jgi:hypothetical protein
MSGWIEFHTTPGPAVEVVIITEVDGRLVIVAGTDGSDEAVEAVEAARQVAMLMGQRLSRSVSMLVDVATATVREIRELDDRRGLTAGQGAC